jgi:hypothetical protein
MVVVYLNLGHPRLRLCGTVQKSSLSTCHDLVRYPLAPQPPSPAKYVAIGCCLDAGWRWPCLRRRYLAGAGSRLLSIVARLEGLGHPRWRCAGDWGTEMPWASGYVVSCFACLFVCLCGSTPCLPR